MPFSALDFNDTLVDSTEEMSGEDNEIPPLGAFMIIMGFTFMLSLEAFLSSFKSNHSDPPIITLTRVRLENFDIVTLRICQ